MFYHRLMLPSFFILLVFSVFIYFFGRLLVCIKTNIIKSEWLPDRSICHLLLDRFCEAAGSRDSLYSLDVDDSTHSTSMTLFEN